MIDRNVMSIDFTPGVINAANGDIYNNKYCDNVKTPDTRVTGRTTPH